jgi:hypothetical protein
MLSYSTGLMRLIRRRNELASLGVLALAVGAFVACEPTALPEYPTYERDIKPLMEVTCRAVFGPVET